MHPLFRFIIRYCSYPAVFGTSAVSLITAAHYQLPYWPLMPLIAISGIALVALLERIQPYEREWLGDQNDTSVDILHAFTSLTLIFSSIFIVQIVRDLAPITDLWPTLWPVWAQVIFAGLIIDFGLWGMHWLSHKNSFLWRLHALHHSPERLYWLNGERRHPLSAILLSIPGISVVVFLGAPPIITACWLSIVAVHLAFQHANLDFSVGKFRKVIAVAEIHRWHHKREFEDAQVNFGEFWLFWDHVFGTYLFKINGVHAGDVGMREPMPSRYVEQLMWPFTGTEYEP